MSDPLADNIVIKRIKRILLSRYNFWPHMFTNAIGLSKLSEEEMETVASLKNINISMGGPDRDAYKQMYNVDKYDSVVRGILSLHAAKQRINSEIKIAIHFRVIDPERLRNSDLYRLFIDLGLECRDISNSFSTFGGVVKQSDVPQGVNILTGQNSDVVIDCVIPHSEYTICPNGDVVACGCFDAHLTTVVGNLYNSSIVDIWKNKLYTDFRHGFSNKSVPDICLTCGNYIPLPSIFSNEGLTNYDPHGETFWHFLR